MTIDEIADLIASPQAECLSSGNYLNRRGIRGYYLQVKCGSNWCKVSVSHADRHSDRITVDELDAIDPNTLQPTVVIPIASISAALKSSSAEQASVGSYVNSAAVEGVWAELHHNGNWYMISVSHLDVPTYASPEELERIADEFLRQQTQNRGHAIGSTHRNRLH